MANNNLIQKIPKRAGTRKRSKKNDALDDAKDTIQKLKSMVRQLRKANKLLQEELSMCSVSSELEDSIQQEPMRKRKCPECKDGRIKHIDAGPYKIHTCDKCGWSQRAEK